MQMLWSKMVNHSIRTGYPVVSNPEIVKTQTSYYIIERNSNKLLYRLNSTVQKLTDNMKVQVKCGCFPLPSPHHLLSETILPITEICSVALQIKLPKKSAIQLSEKH